MPSLSVVKHFDVVEQALPSLVEGSVFLMPHMLGFERMEKALHRCVVVAITFTAHARLDIVLSKQSLITSGSVLHALIGMEQQANRLGTPAQAHFQCQRC